MAAGGINVPRIRNNNSEQLYPDREVFPSARHVRRCDSHLIKTPFRCLMYVNTRHYTEEYQNRLKLCTCTSIEADVRVRLEEDTDVTLRRDLPPVTAAFVKVVSLVEYLQPA